MLSDAQRERLAARLRAGRAGAAPAGIERRPAGQPVPASFGQEQLWFIDKFAPGLASYNVACGLRLRGALDTAALARAIDAFVARHETMRTRLVTDADGRPLQQIDPPAPAPLPLADLTGLDDRQRAAELSRLAGAEAALPFDLAAGPLFRRRLVRLAADEHVLITVLHHAVFDGWSFGVLMRELSALYEAELAGTPPELAELSIQFADYAVWERERLTGPALEEQLSYWRKQLAGLPLVQLPTDRPRPALESHRGAVARLELEPEVIVGARALAAAENTTLHVVLLSVLQVLLARYTGQRDLVVGTPSANRSRPELAPLIGFLVNTLPIRIDCSQDPSFRELLRRVHETTLAGYAHQDLPLAKLVDALQIERDASRTPLFQITFAHAETAPEAIHRGGLAIDVFDGYPDPDYAKFDLAWFVGTNDAGSSAVLQYATDLFEPGTAGRMLEHYRMLLTSAVADPAMTVSGLPMLTDAELYAELIGWNTNEQSVPDATLPQLFAEQVARTPNAPAVLFDGAVTSYAELQSEVSRVSGWLAGQGTGAGDLVGVAMAPSARRLAVVLGILAAGAGYVPLDPALPVERLSFMAGDAAVRLIIADQAALDVLAGLDRPAYCLDEEWDRLPTEAAPVEIDPAGIAYVMYTSGSTGWPKGCVLEHRQVVNFICWMIRQWQVDERDRVLQYASLNFDVSVLDMFTAVLSGATAVVADQQTKLSPPRLTELMRRTGVTLTCLPPAVISLLDPGQLPALRILIAGGEELTTVLALAWQRPGLRLVNGYGPTECTVISTWAEIDGSVLPPPIGRPTTNYRNYVLDADLNPVPVGVVGELHIGGAGVGRGYLNRPELTAQRFIADPFSDDPADRLYKTGDLAKRLPDGQIHYLGRTDGQVKLRGLRIELGEVERAVLSHPAVSQAVVVLREDPVAGGELVGYYRGEAGVEELREHLAGWLPAYMVPAKLIAVTGFVLNASGKIDRSALPDPEPAPVAAERIAPVGPIESALCEIFGRLLGQEQLSVTSSFFDIGGNSLQAMRLLGAIRDELGADLPITEVFLAPSVRQLSSRIATREAGQDPAAGQPVLLELASSTAEQSLLLVHAVGGTVFSYAPLATELAGRYRVCGLQSPVLAGQNRPVPDLAGLAASYLTDLRARQPDGPYRLGGWSMGGLLAYEMAKQLERQGETVELLVLLDAPFATRIEQDEPERLVRHFVEDALRTTGRPVTAIEAVGVEEQLDQLALLLDSGGDGAVRAEVARRFEAFTLHRGLMSGYRPAGEVRAHALLIGADRSFNVTAQSHWQAVLPNAERHLLAADHYTLLRPENARQIAQLVEKAQLDAVL
ncbi:MAG TPA: amino acid adenylation domain-containing protein [Jatrophihabitans sp.]|nr:amino acid adenylation domain-containing protein [Jatrophihabitans sp.]